jgi:hypothetical protein
MTDTNRQLDSLFDSLPRERAGEDFTRNVLGELHRRGQSVFPWRKTAFVAAMSAAGVAAVVSVFWYVSGEMRRSRLEQELADIRADYRQIARQLEALDREAEDNLVIYVGSDEQADYVLDLSELQQRLGESTKPAISPADRGVVGKRSPWPSHDAVPAVYQGGPI